MLTALKLKMPIKLLLKQTPSFNMAEVNALSVSSETTSEHSMAMIYKRVLLDDCAPYSAIGMHELKSSRYFSLPKWNGELEGLSEAIFEYTSWLHGIESHSSSRISSRSPKTTISFNIMAPRGVLLYIDHYGTKDSNLGSVVINVKSDTTFTVRISRIVLDGSSQRVVLTLRKTVIFCTLHTIKFTYALMMVLLNIYLLSIMIYFLIFLSPPLEQAAML